MPTGVVHNFKDVKGGVLDRYYGGEVPTFDMILQRLDQGNFSHATDAIKSAYLFFFGHVLHGIEYQKTVPRWACMFVENLSAFESFPWGTYVYSQTIYYLRRFTTGREGRKKQNRKLSQNQNVGVNVYGFVWTFQFWAMESIPRLTGVHGTQIGYIYPRFKNWRCSNKPKKIDNEFTDEMEAVLTLTPTAYELEQDYMVGFDLDRIMVDGVARDTPDTLANEGMESESDRELLAERLNREMRLKHDHDRRAKQVIMIFTNAKLYMVMYILMLTNIM
ncbi:hypothetical protein Dsin_015947 [Dipteronia sinensis]|uniref:DUF1985 domain-containing protein n=1 Tax=Dipteronia sinensis TaxID=43782 RepID=A0AAE0AC56_9ROSI|nr:hypothetical protein Dsin_015947 [Dipteronia sinensis]